MISGTTTCCGLPLTPRSLPAVQQHAKKDRTHGHRREVHIAPAALQRVQLPPAMAVGHRLVERVCLPDVISNVGGVRFVLAAEQHGAVHVAGVLNRGVRRLAFNCGDYRTL